MIINTAYGKKRIIRRVGPAAEYYFEMPGPSAPHGGWWTPEPAKGLRTHRFEQPCPARGAGIQRGARMMTDKLAHALLHALLFHTAYNGIVQGEKR